MTFVFKCKGCGERLEQQVRKAPDFCDICGSFDLARDYRAESVSFGVVPGGYKDRTSTTMFDRESLKDQGIAISRDQVQDTRSDFYRGLKESGAYD